MKNEPFVRDLIYDGCLYTYDEISDIAYQCFINQYDFNHCKRLWNVSDMTVKKIISKRNSQFIRLKARGAKHYSSNSIRKITNNSKIMRKLNQQQKELRELGI